MENSLGERNRPGSRRRSISPDDLWRLPSRSRSLARPSSEIMEWKRDDDVGRLFKLLRPESALARAGKAAATEVSPHEYFIRGRGNVEWELSSQRPYRISSPWLHWANEGHWPWSNRVAIFLIVVQTNTVFTSQLTSHGPV